MHSISLPSVRANWRWASRDARFVGHRRANRRVRAIALHQGIPFVILEVSWQ